MLKSCTHTVWHVSDSTSSGPMTSNTACGTKRWCLSHLLRVVDPRLQPRHPSDAVANEEHRLADNLLREIPHLSKHNGMLVRQSAIIAMFLQVRVFLRAHAPLFDRGKIKSYSMRETNDTRWLTCLFVRTAGVEKGAGGKTCG